jgi:hypothetical protein
MSLTHRLFGLELCFPTAQGDAYRERVRRLLADFPASASVAEKERLYREFGAATLGELPRAVSGCWDYVGSDRRARAELGLWCSGVTERRGVRRVPAPVTTAFRNDPRRRFLTVTAVLLLALHAGEECPLAEPCDIPEARFWTRATFATLLRALDRVRFGQVRCDALYLIPRDDGWALTDDDLARREYDHLRPLV